MKSTIEIEHPEGTNIVYNEYTKKIEIVSSSILDKVKTFEDASKLLYTSKEIYSRHPAIKATVQLDIITYVLNEGKKLTVGVDEIWYPDIAFRKLEGIPSVYPIVKKFSYKDVVYAVIGVGAMPFFGDTTSPNYISEKSLAGITTTMYPCKSEEIAKYVSRQFGALLFEASFSRCFNLGLFQWIEE